MAKDGSPGGDERSSSSLKRVHPCPFCGPSYMSLLRKGVWWRQAPHEGSTEQEIYLERYDWTVHVMYDIHSKDAMKV